MPVAAIHNHAWSASRTSISTKHLGDIGWPRHMCQSSSSGYMDSGFHSYAALITRWIYLGYLYLFCETDQVLAHTPEVRVLSQDAHQNSLASLPFFDLRLATYRPQLYARVINSVAFCTRSLDSVVDSRNARFGGLASKGPANPHDASNSTQAPQSYL